MTPGKSAFAQKGAAVAPIILEKPPNFLAKRKLKIEGRIQKRKEFLRDHMEQRRNNRIETQRRVAENKRRVAENKRRVAENKRKAESQRKAVEQHKKKNRE